MTIWDTIATERRRLADELDTLTDEQWETPSQCKGWTVEDVAAHVIMPFEISTPRFMVSMLKNRANLDRTMIELTQRVKERNTRSDIAAKLRSNAESQWTPPGGGPESPLGEVVVHGQDIRRVLNIATTVPPETIALTLKGMTDEAIRENYADRIGPVDADTP